MDEFVVLYTKHKTQKRKGTDDSKLSSHALVWQDGFLRTNSEKVQYPVLVVPVLF